MSDHQPWWWTHFWGPVYINFWVTNLEGVGSTFGHVPLLVTLCTDTQGRGLDHLGSLLEDHTNVGAVRHKMWQHPRLVWRAVPLNKGAVDTAAEEAVRGLRRFHEFLSTPPNLKLEA